MPAPEWELDAPLMGAVIRGESGGAERPRLLMNVDAVSGNILFAQAFVADTPLDEMVQTMAAKVRPPDPGAGPLRLLVRDTALGQALARCYPEPAAKVLVVDQLPNLAPALHALEASLRERSASPTRYWAELEANYPDMAGLMADAHQFYRRRPWQQLSDADIIEMKLGNRRRYLSVLGGAGETFGLAVFFSRQGVRQALSGTIAPGSLPTSVSVAFDDAADLGPKLRKELTQRYPIAARNGFPMFMRWERKATALPSRADLDLLRLALQTVPLLAAQVPPGQPAEAVALTVTAEVKASGEPATVQLRFPVPLS